MAATENAFECYHDAGLRLPPVPHELLNRVVEQSEWQFATESADLMDRTGFLEAARDPEAAPMVGFRNVGHGITSRWLCFRLILTPLAIFMRRSYGGVYNDNEASGSIINSATAQIEELIVLADTARRTRRIGPHQRVVLVVDAFGGSGWEITGGGDGWHDSDRPIEEVAALLGGS
jgi:hypothetical protein